MSDNTQEEMRFESLYVHKKDYLTDALTDPEIKLVKETISESREKTMLTHPNAVKVVKISVKDEVIKITTANEDTKDWLLQGLTTWLRETALKVSTSPPNGREETGTLVRCRIRVRNRDRKLDKADFLKHLTVVNAGLDLSGAVIFDQYDLKPQKEYKIIIMGLKQHSIDWLTPREGRVFYDIDYTRIIWDELSKSMEIQRKRKTNVI